MIAVYASHIVSAENAPKFIEIAAEMIAQTRKEKGNISYELVRGIEDPTVLAMMEKWEDMASLEEHMQSEHFKRIVPQLGALSGRGNIVVHEVVI